MQMQRRQFLQLSAAALLATGLRSMARAAPESSPPQSLAEAAGKRGIRYGSTAEVSIAGEPAAYGELLARHCQLFAPGYLSWSWVSPAPGAYDFSREQSNVDFALKHRMSLTGSHLLWYHRVPKWFNSITSPREAEKAIVGHIRAMTARFPFYCWNAVNEALDPTQGRADGLRTNDAMLKILGPDYIDLAFNEARQAAPSSLLAYNEYDLSADTPKHEAKRQALLRLLDRFDRKRTPIDVVGLQSHLEINLPFNEKKYREFLREVSSRGLKIFISELDIRDVGAPADWVKRDQLVADFYSRFLAVSLDETAVAAVVNWGLSDRYTWLTPSFSPELVRPDGLPMRPLPFDGDFNPKPAYYAMLRAFENAPARQPFVRKSA